MPAQAYALQGEWGKTAQEFKSNGVAPVIEDVKDILTDMHPSAEPPPHPEYEPTQQLQFKGKHIYGTRLLQTTLKVDRSTRGLYGWSTSILKLIAGEVELPSAFDRPCS